MTDFTVIETTQGITITIDDDTGQTVIVETTPTVDLEVSATGIQGPPGPQGEAGPAGAPGGTRYNHTQTSPAPVWTVQHNLGYEPLFATVVINGEDVTDGSDIFHIDTNNLTVSFSEPVAGKAAFL